jgi:YD repeat-containing protein
LAQVSRNPGSTISPSASGAYDGWSRPTQTVNVNNGQVNTTYDPSGRVTSQTNPFPAGGSPGPATTYGYDTLGRRTVTTLPDGSVVLASYSGNLVTSTDPVGRKVQRQSDGLGRLISVTEQDPNGNLTQQTSYSYDLLNNLIQVNQGGDHRSTSAL